MYVYTSASMENRLNSRTYGFTRTEHDFRSAGVNSRSSNEEMPISSSQSLPAGSGAGSLHTAVGPAHALLGLGRQSNSFPVVESAPPQKRPRKERAPNWSAEEMNALVSAKRSTFIQDAGRADARELMIPDSTKWLRISVEVSKSCFSPVPRDGPACKSKWNQMIPEYKRIVDYLSCSGTNEASYWSLTKSARKSEGLPLQFPEEVFFNLHEWYVTKPTIRPPHSRDLLSADDSNYGTPLTGSEDADHDESTFGSEEQALDGHGCNDDTNDGTRSTESPMMQVGSSKFRVLMDVPLSTPSSSSPPTSKSFIPPSITPHFLSSSDTSADTNRKTPGNIGVRRKSVSGHSIIAEAMRATGEAMTCQMKEMAAASRDLEKSKMDVQFRLFTEQMDYQRERDRKLHENARLTNNNAKLSIMKQGELVACLAQLSTVLTTSLISRRDVPFNRGAVQPPVPSTVVPVADGNTVVPSASAH